MPETFDLEEAVRAWRAEAAAKNIRNGTLEELERHLRDACAQLVGDGISESEAWEQAKNDLGSPGELVGEYAKIGHFNLWDRIALLVVGLGICVVIQIVILRLVRGDGVVDVLKNDVLLGTHVIFITTAFCFAVLVGFCGAYVLTRRKLSDHPCPRVHALFRKCIVVFSAIVFVGSLGGFILGLIWAKQVSGVHSNWYDPRVLGCVALILWSAASLWFIVVKGIGPKWLFRLAVVGSVIITEMWLLIIIFGGRFDIGVAAAATLLYAAQLVPFCLNWNEDFPEKKPACN